MEFVLTMGTAASATTMMVALYKFAFPQTPASLVVLVSLLSGVGLSLLVTTAQGGPLNAQNAATAVMAGIFAAATAAGVRGADNKADEKRMHEKRVQTQEH